MLSSENGDEGKCNLMTQVSPSISAAHANNSSNQSMYSIFLVQHIHVDGI